MPHPSPFPWLLAVALNGPAFAGASAEVTVQAEAGQVLATWPATAVGVNAGVFDDFFGGATLPAKLKAAGVTVLRFPDGTPSDQYHWRTHKLSPNTPRFWLSPRATFDDFMGLAKAAGGQALITVNYGSDSLGKGGGDPAEAAAWVRYANRDRGYGIRYWEIGNETFGDWEPDLRADKSPAGYVAAANGFIQAMRAADPTIKIGIPLTAAEGVAADWNAGVLPGLCADIDFAVIHWYPQKSGQESDAGLLASARAIPGVLAKVKADLAAGCGPKASQVQIWLTETNSSLPPASKQQVGLVAALWAADAFAAWLEGGVANVDWESLHLGPYPDDNPALYGAADFGDWGLFANGTCSDYLDPNLYPKGGPSSKPPCAPSLDTPYPVWHTLRLLSSLARPGDAAVAATSTAADLRVHAWKRADGKFAALLINQSPSRSRQVEVRIAGFGPAAAISTLSYGLGDDTIRSGALKPADGAWVAEVPAYTALGLTFTPAFTGLAAGADPAPELALGPRPRSGTFNLPRAMVAGLRLRDARGRVMRELLPRGSRPAGPGRWELPGGLAAGVYRLELYGEGWRRAKSLVVTGGLP